MGGILRLAVDMPHVSLPGADFMVSARQPHE
jgi:hypothetical protein